MSDYQFIFAKGDVADRVRAFAWDKTELGAISTWPATLLTSVNTMLASRFPTVIFWGPSMIQFFNDAYRPLLAEKEPRALGQGGKECWEEAWHIIGPQFERVFGGESIFEENVMVPVMRDGRLQDIFWTYSYSPIFHPGGGVAGILIVCHDVTNTVMANREREALTSRTERQRAELEAVYNTAPIGLALFDPHEFRYLRLNNRQAEIVGLPIDQIVGAKLTDIAPIPGLRELFEQVAGGEPVRNFQLEGALATDPTEHRFWMVNYFPVMNADGKVAAISAASLEITQQKRAEAALIQNDKLAAVGRLAASIAHEINNPLESVTNLLYLARRTASLEEIEGYLGLAERELRRVSVIANQTLRFYRQSSKPREVTAADLFDSVLSIYQGRLVNAQVHVEQDYRSPKPITCFEGEIRQVLGNLIGNAIDAMTARGGRLILRSRVATDGHNGEPGMRLTVADTGPGIPMELRRKIFEAFYTTKGLGGTGLGLWISEEIVARHKGTLRVRSRTGDDVHGTVFSLFLPFDAVQRT